MTYICGAIGCCMRMTHPVVETDSLNPSDLVSMFAVKGVVNAQAEMKRGAIKASISPSSSKRKDEE